MSTTRNLAPPSLQRGVTLIELITFIVVISLALGALVGVYRYAIVSSVDPIVRVRLLESAQSQLDVVLAQAYDGNTPPGGVPACGGDQDSVPPGNPEPPPCSGSGGVSSFDGYSDSPYSGYSREVTVAFAGDDLGLADNESAKRITVVVTSPGGESLTLAAYRTNF